MFRKLAIALSLVAVVVLAACNNQPAGIAVTGGGFIFNYRLAVAYAGLIVVPHGNLPEKSRVEVTMENPAGGALIVMNQSPIGGGKIEFTTDPLTGIVANKEYLVSVRLIAADGTELQRIDKKFHSELDQSVLPPAPLTVGPGYTPNPAATPDPNKSL